jgi:hypothetical protein
MRSCSSKEATLNWTFVALRALLALLVVAYASTAYAFIYTFEDSTMSTNEENDILTIVFLEPGPSAKERGIKPYEVLFEGTVDWNGQLSGKTYAFKDGCLPEPYGFDVKGVLTSYQIDLFGTPPIFRGESCEVDHYSDMDPSTHLTLQFYY